MKTTDGMIVRAVRYSVIMVWMMITGYYADAQSWQWAASMGNNGASANTAPDEKVNDMAVDQWGNVYVTGEIMQGGLIGGQQVPYWGIWTTGFIAKYDCLGNLIWAKTFGSFQPAYGSQIELDATGNVFFTGSAVGNNTIPGYELHFLDSVIADVIGDAFVARVDTGGQLLWVQFAAPNVTELGTIIQGFTLDRVNQLVVLIGVGMPGEVYTGHQCPDRGTYVFKFDTLGNVLSSGFLTDLINGLTYWSIASDADHNNYLSLYFQSDTLLFGGQQIIKQGTAQRNLLFIKVDSLLNTQWYEQMGDSLIGVGYGVQIDSLNNAYFTGWVPDGRSLQGHVFTNPGGAPNAHVTFIAKFSSNGTLIWADNVISQYGSTGDGKLAIDKFSGKLWFSGTYRGLAHFGNTTLSSVSMSDCYLAEVDPSGVVQSAATFLSTGNYPYSNTSITTVDNSGNAYIGGSFDGTITINGTVHANQGGRSNGFIAKYGYQCSTGIEEEQEAGAGGALQVYPNPVSETLHIVIPAANSVGNIKITDITGRIVFQSFKKAVEEDIISIQVSGLTSGLYFVVLQNANEIWSSRFIKN